MANEIFPESQLPIRRTLDLLPGVFQTEPNKKFLAGTLDALTQPGVLNKVVGYVGKRYGKTYNPADVYLDSDETLRSRYQLEPSLTIKENGKVIGYHDYIDFKNQLRFFGNRIERDDLITDQDHYSWDPPIDWDKFINYRDYYWVPEGPPPVKVLGEAQDVVSTYRVKLGVGSVFIFTPDGLKNNPTITLYRGQTYRFIVNAPDNGFIIRTAYDTGSLRYNPDLPYVKGQLVVFDGKLWQAKTDIPVGDGSTIDENSQDWEYLEPAAAASSLDYNIGVTNNGVSNGTLTFKVSFDAPDVLFYQSLTDPNRFGRFLIQDVESNTKIDVENEIVGKTTYRSSNGVELSNGMIVYFLGQVTPAQYSQGTWVVEGVGSEIKLIRFTDLIPPGLSADLPEVLFDNEGFDTQPFDDATSYPSIKDYVTINKASQDSNAWSRYNRWWHKSVLEYSHQFNGTDFASPDTARAKRPIIEFKRDLKLFNHGAKAKQPVDFVDTFTTDVFSNIEGSKGYIVDGVSLFQGARLLVTADTDSLVNNKIYEVNFILHNNSRQINLRETSDTDPIIDESVLVLRGDRNQGVMYHYTGTNWVRSQAKTTVNQSPRFDVFDENAVSFGDTETYTASTFSGSEIVSYKQSGLVADRELGFGLSYLNINNVGDILFDFDWDTETFSYEVDRNSVSKKVATGFYRFNDSGDYGNNWTKTNRTFLQPIIDATTITEETSTVEINAVNWLEIDESKITKILLFVNGTKFRGEYTREKNKFTLDRLLQPNDVVSIEIYGDVEPYRGYYEIPLGLEKNPLNQPIQSFTLGQAVDHVNTALELYDDFQLENDGKNNLRDISGYGSLGRRFLKHSGLTPLALLLLCDKQVNVIKAIEEATYRYADFKGNFLKFAETLDYAQDPVALVDDVIAAITRAKKETDAYQGSDMIGAGSFTELVYEVEDEGIKTFALSEKFDLSTPSSRAVYVYINNQQLLNGTDYEFNSVFGFVNLKVNLAEGDVIKIREYLSTAFNYIPPTPTKLGLYKKYTPRKFLDDTYATPMEVIQGHDGSITAAFGDYRDDAILELEKRIYNNIKVEYNEQLFDIDHVFGGYYGGGIYDKAQLDKIIAPQFRKWALLNAVEFTENTGFDIGNEFTFNYSSMTAENGTVNLPGYWRGCYRWFFDTDRPHTAPWEMLGFSEKPDWWDQRYGSAPYTSNNLILWEDLRDGIIRQGDRAGVYERYKRPTLLNHIPVDGDGNLLDPLASGLAENYSELYIRRSFKFGDVSPAEHAWRTSSNYPFAIALASVLYRPFEYILENLDGNLSKINKIGQTVSVTSDLFVTVSDIVVPSQGSNGVSGVINWIADYLKSRSMSVSLLSNKINNIDVNLATRLSGFVDQSQQRYVLDSKNPSSKTAEIFVPQENYDIFFNISSPTATLTYSAIIIEKTETGYRVRGYDNLDPVFRYYQFFPSQTDPLLSVGGVSASFVDWEPGRTYNNGAIIRFSNRYYRVLTTHTTLESFDETKFKILPDLPIEGAAEAFKRKNFNRNSVKELEYGHVFNSKQAVVDFLCGYEAYQLDQGFDFQDYDAQLQDIRNWTTSIKEFLFWTRHSWAVGSLLSLSPGANKVKLNIGIGVAESFFDGFYDYQILQGDGTVLQPTLINVDRDFKTVTVTTENDTDGIYLVKFYLVLKEHVTVFSDRTVFNDVLYDKTTGYRQERIKNRGFRTVDWDGDYTSPGFLFDNLKIDPWQPFTDYKLGDIVSYRSYNWTSLENQQGKEEFDNSRWEKLDTTPQKQLVPNFDFRANLFLDYYNVDADGIGAGQRELARHAIGYQQREYLEALAEDEVMQFKLYQGFIKEKGTANAIKKVFDKLSKVDDDSIELKEEWAFAVGRVGGVDQLSQVEFEIKKQNLIVNPQPVQIIEGSLPQIDEDQVYRINQDSFNYGLVPFTKNVNPLEKFSKLNRSAGYVKVDQIDYAVKTRSELADLDITQIPENSHIWVTFDNNSWTVLRFNHTRALFIKTLVRDGTRVDIEFNRVHGLRENDYLGIRDIPNLTGFYAVNIVDDSRIFVEIPLNSSDPEFEESSVLYPIYLLSEARFANYQTLDQRKSALMSNGAKIWIDDNGSNDLWQVVEKQSAFTAKEIQDTLLSLPTRVGQSVLYIEGLKQSIIAAPGVDRVITLTEYENDLRVSQIIAPAENYENVHGSSMGYSLAVSPDNQWLAIGSPLASGVKNRFKGPFNPSGNYAVGDIVFYQGKLWACQNEAQLGDGSSITVYSENWRQVDLVTANLLGSPGPGNQGMISLYRWRGSRWEWQENILSPRISENERFGDKISLGISGTTYYMSVSAPGAREGTGRVYLFQRQGTSWKIFENPDYRGIYVPSGQYSPITGQFETGGIKAANSLVIGNRYEIIALGSTNWNTVAGTSGITYIAGDIIIVKSVGTGTGTAEPRSFYPQGSIVWWDSNLWQAPSDSYGNILITDLELAGWQVVSDTMVQSSLPTNIGMPDDESTLNSGMYGIDQQAELLKDGDGFGTSMAMSRDGSILVIGSPYSDGVWFEKYRGEWNSYQEYREGDVVRYNNEYWKMVEPGDSTEFPDSSLDSTYAVFNSVPGADDNWYKLDTPDDSPKGKVFVYKRNSNLVYKLVQTITADSLSSINDTDTVSLERGDLFGFSVDMDQSGSTLIIGSPNADNTVRDQGAVYVFRTTAIANPSYRLKQKLESFEDYPSEFFGVSSSISGRGERIAVGANNGKVIDLVRFDTDISTTFDKGITTFVSEKGNTGQVYIFDLKDETYFLTEKLADSLLQDFESFGSSIDVTNLKVLVGSPTFTDSEGDVRGTARLYNRDPSITPWNVIAEENLVTDLDKIKRISLFDVNQNLLVDDLDVIDNYKLKISSLAEQEITWKTIYDPAVYTAGNDEVEIDEPRAWFENNVGKLWWDLSTVKFLNYEQGDISYRTGNWNQQAPGSSVDVYEWVESRFLPSQWSELADTVEGLSLGISGQPKYPDDTVYSVKVLYNLLSGEVTSTRYYFWVKNKTIVPENVPGRRTSSSAVTNLIANPQGSGQPFIAVIDQDKFLLFNIKSALQSDDAVLNIEYQVEDQRLNPVHREYQLLTEGVFDSVPAANLENKWIDSLVGYDLAGNKVPDEKLPEKQKYGLSFRPRQTMFVNRFEVLRAVIENINSILLLRPFADTINYRNLNLVDPVPDSVLNEYDTVVDRFIDLQNVGTVRVTRAILTPNIVDGSIETIDIQQTGFGYKVTPFVEIEGDGTGAKAEVTIDNQGKINSVTVTQKGKNYTSAVVKIRSFSVLVNQDETNNNFWSIYSWDDQRKVFFKTKMQGFDTSRYWSYIDWYAPGFTKDSRVILELDNIYQEPTISVRDGDIIRIKEFGSGGWALLIKVAEGSGNISGRYNLIGRKNGTIEISDQFYNPTLLRGFDNAATFDANLYDLQPVLELRNIFRAVKEDIFIEDFSAEWNKLFFTSVRYAFVQQPYVDWAFKTSFLNAIHNVGELDQRPTYKNDNLESYQDYIEEVKPYRTTIREFVSRYNKLDNTQTAYTDFDCPPTYAPEFGQILPVNESYPKPNEYPWKWWYDNQGYSVISIEVYDSGNDYIDKPQVVIQGDGSGATAQAYISNGRVSAVQVTNPGSGYTRAPTVILVGGNGTSQNIAKAAAIIGNGVVRSVKLGMKFDRIDKRPLYSQYLKEETFVATGATAVFDLKYAPTIDKDKITVFVNNQLSLTNEYNITLFIENIDGYNLLKGKITFVTSPNSGDVITVNYNINDSYLSAVDRINRYYAPTDGMLGNDLPQLMTGIDYGGVQIQGTTFDVTGGWDALPWFTDNWDSVEPNTDYFYVADGSTVSVTLPYTPAAGEPISIYLQRAGETRQTRIDDPAWTPSWDSTVSVNPAAQMPTFIGDGSTKVVSFVDETTDLPYVSLQADDILIFRSFESDGSVQINDVNIIDTRLSGGSLSNISGAYQSATGLTSQEIVVDGYKFVSPEQVPSPEENVPGQVLESVSIKVFHTKTAGAAPLQNTVYTADGETTTYDIGLRILEANSVMVYVDKVKIEYGDSTLGFDIDYINNEIVFVSAPSEGSIIEVIAIGLGGINLLDYQEFTADGETKLFLTKAIYSQTSAVLVTLDGVQIDVGYYDSQEFTDTIGRTIVEFGQAPEFRQTVKILCVGEGLDTDSTGLSVIRSNRQTIYYDGSTTRIPLDNFVSLSRANSNSAVLIDINGQQIKGPDTVRVVYDGTNNIIRVGDDLGVGSGSITFNDLQVYINNELQQIIVNYQFNTITNIVDVSTDFLSIGDEIKILVTVLSDYTIDTDELVLNPVLAASMTENDIIEVQWFSEYPSFDLITDQYIGGQVRFKLRRIPISSSFIWVYKNGNRLTKDQDFEVDVQRGFVYLKDSTSRTDEIKIVEFGDKPWDFPICFELFKDMLNINQFKRYARTEVVLSKVLNYYDQNIEVNDASSLFDPSAFDNRLPGVVIINNERIEYYQKIGNILTQLRRGSFGTAIAEAHALGSFVVDSGPGETIPYAETQSKYDFVGDGSTNIIGPLDFVPAKTDITSWYRDTIPAEYGQCDILEVFVGGRRLRKAPTKVYDELNGVYSPAADNDVEAEFSVDGINNYIRLSEPPAAGVRITIIRRIGRSWYDRGLTTITSGKTLNENDNAIANFLLQKPTIIPE